MDMPKITYSGDVSRFVSAEGWDEDTLMLYKDLDYFQDQHAYDTFVKGCESAVRTSPDYKVFIGFIKSKLGINFCQVSSQIYDTDATIEMHHGPILTLYDICSIMVNDFLRKNKKIDTPRITDAVIDEHFELRVQVAMLAVTNHEAAHNQDLFLHVKQGVGNLNEFIDLYNPSFDDIHKYKIWNYINMCKNNPSFDTGYLDVSHVEKIIKL